MRNEIKAVTMMWSKKINRKVNSKINGQIKKSLYDWIMRHLQVFSIVNFQCLSESEQ